MVFSRHNMVYTWSPSPHMISTDQVHEYTILGLLQTMLIIYKYIHFQLIDLHYIDAILLYIQCRLNVF